MGPGGDYQHAHALCANAIPEPYTECELEVPNLPAEGREVTQGRYPYTQLDLFQESLLEENPEKAFYGSEEDEAKGPGSEEAATAALPARKPYVMDPDHRLLLRNTKPLLQSRSAAVVMAVAQLYFHLAPKAEVGVIAKALVRLLRSHRYREPRPLRRPVPVFSHQFLPPSSLANLSSPNPPPLVSTEGFRNL